MRGVVPERGEGTQGGEGQRARTRYRTPTEVRAVLRPLRFLVRAVLLERAARGLPPPLTRDTPEEELLTRALEAAAAALRAYKAGAYRVPRLVDGMGMLEPDDRHRKSPASGARG